jgi:guanosine-3',5'-bis(diphosphate) 3'-pyrophosphohydrolase
MGGKPALFTPPTSPLLPADSEDSQLSLHLKQYHKPEDIDQVMAAYRFSAAAHEGQFRKSGEPYISHPVTVACILAELHLDPPSLMAALLHDVKIGRASCRERVYRHV